jgi:hypothetical protein
VAGMIKEIEKIHLIGSRTRDLSACRIVFPNTDGWVTKPFGNLGYCSVLCLMWLLPM